MGYIEQIISPHQYISSLVILKSGYNKKENVPLTSSKAKILVAFKPPFISPHQCYFVTYMIYSFETYFSYEYS
jgi:hypothetical protein